MENASLPILIFAAFFALMCIFCRSGAGGPVLVVELVGGVDNMVLLQIGQGGEQGQA